MGLLLQIWQHLSAFPCPVPWPDKSNFSLFSENQRITRRLPSAKRENWLQRCYLRVAKEMQRSLNILNRYQGQMSVLSACMMYGMNEWMNENKYWNKLLGNRVLLSFTRIAPYRQMNFTFPFWNCLLNHKQAVERLSLLVKLLERRERIEITGNYALVWNGKCINHRQSWISKDELKMNENSIVEEWKR